VLGTIGVAWWYNRPRPPPVAHAPVSVVISDFANGTGDTGLDRTLEPVIKLSLESAPFITAYAHSDVRRALNVDPPDPFDERAANELAVKQGLGVVVAGTIERVDQGYRLQATARQAVTGKVVARAERDASARDGVLAAVGRLSEEIRKRLGDESSDAEQRFAMDTLTATSLDVVHDYAVAMEALSSSQFEAARASFQRAVERDPAFGLAYAGRAIASANLGKQQEAQKDISEAVRHVDRMTERERFRARGLYYYLTSDYPSCVKEYGALVARYRSDAAAHNNRALCLTRLREMPQALDEMREVVTILPNRALYRVNLALYAAYASDFTIAQAEAVRAQQMSPLGNLPLAFASSGRAGSTRRGGPGRPSARPARSERPSPRRVSVTWPSTPAATPRRCASWRRGRRRTGQPAIPTARRPRSPPSPSPSSPGAERRRHRRSGQGHRRERDDAGPLPRRAHLRAHRRDRGCALHRPGSGRRAPRRARAHAKVLEADLALAGGDPRRAISLLGEASGLLDTWIGRFELARAYLEARAFAQADSELDRCITRRGEALALFLDEEPTFGMTPLLDYTQGRVREGLGTAGFADAYQRYLDRRGAAGEDALLPEIRKADLHRRLAGHAALP
jgi:tetratricopeptide (TPR) repeat protein